MNKPQNWNDMSGSQSQDSWFDDDQQPQKPQNNQISQQSNPKQTSPIHQQSSSLVQSQVSPSSSSLQIKKQHKAKYLSDAQLLIKYKNKQVDNTFLIKIVKCFNENVEIIKKLQLRRMKELPIEEEDLLKFIEDKINNRYKFYLQLFYKRKEEGDRKRYKEGDKEKRYNQGDKEKRYNRGDRQKQYGQGDKRREKPKYISKQGSQKQSQQQRPKQRKSKEQYHKKTYLPKQNYQILNNKNVLIIKNQKYDTQKVYQQLQTKNIYNEFNRLKIRLPISCMEKVVELVSKIGNQKKWYLQDEPKGDKQGEDKLIEMVLKQNGSNDKTIRFIQKYNKNAKQDRVSQTKPQHLKSQLKSQTVRVKPNHRYLGSAPKQYFINLSRSNVSELIKGFDQNQYIKQLKERHSQIFKCYSLWKIQAQDDNIQNLLRLEYRLKKSGIYDIQLRPGSRNQVMVLMMEIRIRPEKERRPKVDVSGINAILS